MASVRYSAAPATAAHLQHTHTARTAARCTRAPGAIRAKSRVRGSLAEHRRPRPTPEQSHVMLKMVRPVRKAWAVAWYSSSWSSAPIRTFLSSTYEYVTRHGPWWSSSQYLDSTTRPSGPASLAPRLRVGLRSGCPAGVGWRSDMAR